MNWARSPDTHATAAVAALVEDLGDRSVEFLAVGGPVEADADIAGGQIRIPAHHPPRTAASLVVQRSVQVPRASGLVPAGAGISRRA